MIFVKKGANGEDVVVMVKLDCEWNPVQYLNEEHGYPREACIKIEVLACTGIKWAEILKVIHQKNLKQKNIPIHLRFRQSSQSFARAR